MVHDILAPKDTSDDAQMRAGQIICACPASLPRAETRGDNLTLAAGFGLAVLAQAITLTVLPEQSRLIAPTVERIGWPDQFVDHGSSVSVLRAAYGLSAEAIYQRVLSRWRNVSTAAVDSST